MVVKIGCYAGCPKPLISSIEELKSWNIACCCGHRTCLVNFALEIGLLKASLVENILLAAEQHRTVLIISGIVGVLFYIKVLVVIVHREVHAAC